MLKLEAKYLLLPPTKYFKLTSKMKEGYLSTLKYIIKWLIFKLSVINFKIYRNGCTVCWHLVWENSQIVNFLFTITKCAHKNITIPSPDCRNIFVNPARRMRGRSSSPRWRSYLLILITTGAYQLISRQSGKVNGKSCWYKKDNMNTNAMGWGGAHFLPKSWFGHDLIN